jgi:putative ABC transport system permease protein
MKVITQSLAVLRISLSTVHQRVATWMTIVVAVACVTGVIASVLSVSSGLSREYGAAEDAGWAMVLPIPVAYEDSERIARSDVGTILNAPGIARSPEGHPIGGPEVFLHVASGGGTGGYISVRGVGAGGIALRPDLKIVSGRMFRSGQEELIIGSSAARGFHLKVGDTVTLTDGTWPIVGEFASPGVRGSELIGDADTLAVMAHRGGFGSVQVRLTSPAAFAEFKAWLTANPALTVHVHTQQEYFMGQASMSAQYFNEIAVVAGALLSLGALFASVNVLYGAVSARTREMATLRAIGYGGLPVALSVVFEALLFAFLGAGIGEAAAWALLDGRQIAKFEVVYQLFVSPGLIFGGFGLAALLALLGSVLPASRAARLDVAKALLRCEPCEAGLLNPPIVRIQRPRCSDLIKLRFWQYAGRWWRHVPRPGQASSQP